MGLNTTLLWPTVVQYNCDLSFKVGPHSKFGNKTNDRVFCSFFFVSSLQFSVIFFDKTSISLRVFNGLLAFHSLGWPKRLFFRHDQATKKAKMMYVFDKFQIFSSVIFPLIFLAFLSFFDWCLHYVVSIRGTSIHSRMEVPLVSIIAIFIRFCTNFGSEGISIYSVSRFRIGNELPIVYNRKSKN